VEAERGLCDTDAAPSGQHEDEEGVLVISLVHKSARYTSNQVNTAWTYDK
jgi:hypothetical protein